LDDELLLTHNMFIFMTVAVQYSNFELGTRQKWPSPAMAFMAPKPERLFLRSRGHPLHCQSQLS